MKKFLMIMAIVLLPPLGAIVASKNINKANSKINELKEQIELRDIAIDVLLENKEIKWGKEQQESFKKKVKILKK